MLSNMSRNPSQSSLQTLPSPSSRNVPRCRIFMPDSLFCGNLAAKESIERNLRESSAFTKPNAIRCVPSELNFPSRPWSDLLRLQASNGSKSNREPSEAFFEYPGGSAAGSAEASCRLWTTNFVSSRRHALSTLPIERDESMRFKQALGGGKPLGVDHPCVVWPKPIQLLAHHQPSLWKNLKETWMR